MKVILKQDVNKIGAAGEMIETSDGYARNFLFPRNLAEEATPERIKEWKDREASKKKKEERLQKEARELQAAFRKDCPRRGQYGGEGQALRQHHRCGRGGKPGLPVRCIH